MSDKLNGLREGDVLAGKYRVERVLGAGGMGVVVAAHHLGLDTNVAIKLLRPELLGQEDVVARFAREARAAARISNDHVARVFDVGQLEDGTPYMVMEFLNGSDLGERLRQRGPLPVAQAVDFLLQACEAVAEAHSLGIVHRDLKPANLFCVERTDGTLCIKVLDFGISKVSNLAGGAGTGFSMTATSAVMGTPYYMSPEQMESAREADGRADIWSLGVILFELLTARVPFLGESLPEVCIKIATHAPPPIRQLRPDIAPGLEDAILRCLQKDRNRRFATVAEFAAALGPFSQNPSNSISNRLRQTNAAAPRPPMISSPGSQPPASFDQRELLRPAPNSESLSAFGQTKGGFSRRKTAAFGIVGASVAVAVLAIVGALWVTRSPPAQAPAAPVFPTASGTTRTVVPAERATIAPPPAETTPVVEPAIEDAGAPAADDNPPPRDAPVKSLPKWHHQSPSREPGGTRLTPSKPTGGAPDQAASSNAFDERL